MDRLEIKLEFILESEDDEDKVFLRIRTSLGGFSCVVFIFLYEDIKRS